MKRTMILWGLGFQGLLSPILVEIKSVLKGWISDLDKNHNYYAIDRYLANNYSNW